MGHVYHGYVSLLEGIYIYMEYGTVGRWSRLAWTQRRQVIVATMQMDSRITQAAPVTDGKIVVFFETGNLNRLNLFGKNRMGCNIKVADNGWFGCHSSSEENDD